MAHSKCWLIRKINILKITHIHHVCAVPPAYYAHLAAFRARYYDEPPAMDGASSVGSGGQPPAVRRLPQIKENVKDVMFYC